MIDLDTFMSKYNRYHQALAKCSEGNKGTVFDVLAAGSITEVLVEFDGAGDSGQIESMSAMRGQETVPLPQVNVTLQRLSWGDTEPVAADGILQEAIETLCYDYLEVTHDGWENNDGAYGEFRFDVATRTIELEFNGRFTDVSTSNHTF
jgi:hypothetical protein